jgi:hypothetical protein
MTIDQAMTVRENYTDYADYKSSVPAAMQMRQSAYLERMKLIGIYNQF